MRTKININDIADLLLLLCFENGVSISPLKLQKLLYYTQAWHWVYFGKENDLFEELPQAWVNGPVYPTIYERFKHIGIYDPITPSSSKISRNLSEQNSYLQLDVKQNEYIDSIFQFYGTKDHDSLVFLTHSEAPWSEKRVGLSPFEPSNQELSKDTMFGYYSDRMKRNREKMNKEKK